MRFLTAFIASAAAALALAGCHSIGDDQNVKISSEPSDAVVRIGGVEAGHTPLTVALATHFATELRIEKNGFKTEIITVSAKRGGALHPNPVDVKLVPAFMPDDLTKADLKAAQETLKWMKDSGQFAKEDIAYMEAYLKDFFKLKD